MKNFVQHGQTVTLTAPYDVASGAGMKVGTLFAVAAATALSGASVEGCIEGVYDLPKATGAITQGAKVYWDDTAKNVTTTATSNMLIGAATEARASGDATVRVRLNGVAV